MVIPLLANQDLMPMLLWSNLPTELKLENYKIRLDKKGTATLTAKFRSLKTIYLHLFMPSISNIHSFY